MQEPPKRAEGAGLNAQGHRQDEERLTGVAEERRITCGSVSRHLAPIAWASGLHLFPSDCGTQGPPALRPPLGPVPPREQDRFSGRIQSCIVPHHPEGVSPWTIGCAGWFGGLSRTTGAARRLAGAVMPGLDDARGRRERDKLTIAEVCADLGISRRTFYEWRAKGRAPRCITLPNGSLRVRRSEYQRWLASREEAA